MNSSAAPAMDPSKQDELLASVTGNILERIQNNTLALPSMPIAVARCMALLRENDFSLRQAAQVIERDPLLAARVLSVSNSAAFGGLALHALSLAFDHPRSEERLTFTATLPAPLATLLEELRRLGGKPGSSGGGRP